MDINITTIGQLPKDNPSNDYELVGGTASDQLTTITVKKLADFLAAGGNTMLKSDYAAIEGGSPSSTKVALAANAEKLDGLSVGTSHDNIPKYNSNGALITAVATAENEAVRLSQLSQLANIVEQKIPLSRVSENANSPSDSLPTLALVKALSTTSATKFRGFYDPSANDFFPNAGNAGITGSGVNGAIVEGDFWMCNKVGTIQGLRLPEGSTLAARIDNPSAINTDSWVINIAAENITYENSANKSFSFANPSHTTYPTTLAVTNEIASLLDVMWSAFPAANITADIAEYRVFRNYVEMNFKNLKFNATPYTLSLPTIGSNLVVTNFFFMCKVNNSIVSASIIDNVVDFTGVYTANAVVDSSLIAPIVTKIISNPLISTVSVFSDKVTISVELGVKNSVYDVFKDNVKIAENVTSSTFDYTGLTPLTTYSLQIEEVRGADSKNVQRIKSNILSVKTIDVVTKEQFAFFSDRSFKVENISGAETSLFISMFGDGGDYIASSPLPAGVFGASAGGGGYWDGGVYMGAGFYLNFTATSNSYIMSQPNSTTAWRTASKGGNTDGITGGIGGASTSATKYGENGADQNTTSENLGGLNGKKENNGYGRGAKGMIGNGLTESSFGEKGGIGLRIDNADPNSSAIFNQLFKVTYL